MNTPILSSGGTPRLRSPIRSLYVVILPCTRSFKHWRGYRDYDRARAIADDVGAIVSSAQWLRRRFYPAQSMPVSSTV
jgi:hypothetical protein